MIIIIEAIKRPFHLIDIVLTTIKKNRNRYYLGKWRYFKARLKWPQIGVGVWGPYYGQRTTSQGFDWHPGAIAWSTDSAEFEF